MCFFVFPVFHGLFLTNIFNKSVLNQKAMRKQTNRDHRHMSKMELEVRRQKAAADRKSVQVRCIDGHPPSPF